MECDGCLWMSVDVLWIFGGGGRGNCGIYGHDLDARLANQR